MQWWAQCSAGGVVLVPHPLAFPACPAPPRPTPTLTPPRRYPNRYESIIGTLCDSLESLDEPEAKASMVWIIGEYAERIDNADELLEQFLESFPEETAAVQLQLMTATVKLFLKKPVEKPQQLIQLVLTYATQETDNPDLRDRAYIYWRLLSSDPGVVRCGAQAGRPAVEAPAASAPPPPPPLPPFGASVPLQRCAHLFRLSPACPRPFRPPAPFLTCLQRPPRMWCWPRSRRSRGPRTPPTPPCCVTCWPSWAAWPACTTSPPPRLSPRRAWRCSARRTWRRRRARRAAAETMVGGDGAGAVACVPLRAVFG